MKIKNALANIDILIADSDRAMRQVLTQNLRAMGMRRIHHVKNGDEALAFISEHHVDLLITEWAMRPTDGIMLLHYLRRNPETPNRLLPTIMLTGKGEVSDVEMARDQGITEFMIKPFTARSLYLRIEAMVDHPRNFIVSSTYCGPDRRRRSNPDYTGPERRKVAPQAKAPNQLTPGEPDAPEVAVANHALKKAIGITGTLATIITTEMIENAQQAIRDMSDASLDWLREDLTNLEKALKEAQENDSIDARDRMKDSALSIKSRAGTFGRHLASKIARLLYLFLTMKYQGWQKVHHVIVAKHIDALKIAILLVDSDSTNQSETALGRELVSELERLIDRA